MDYQFFEYSIDSMWYKQAVVLRENLLRKPLGLSLSMDDVATDDRSWHFGLGHLDTLLATVVTQPLNSHTVKLRQMVVASEYQEQGLGLLLLKQVESALVDKSIQKIMLASRDTAVGFYKKLGFKEQGPTYHHLRIGHQDMVKVIELKSD